MMRTSAVLALAAAVAMATVKVLLAERLWWPFQADEYVAAAALAFGSIVVLRAGQGRMLAAGWAFTLGITWSSFFHHLMERPSWPSRKFHPGHAPLFGTRSRVKST